MTPFQTFWITAGLLAVAAAMYRMGSIVASGKKATEAIAKEFCDFKAEYAEFKRDVVAAIKELSTQLQGHDRRLGICEERGGAISKMIEKQAHTEHVLDGLVAVCAERHENSLRLELDDRGADTDGIPRRRP